MSGSPLAETELLIGDLTWPRCGERLEAALGRIDGVLQATVDWRTGRLRVRHEPGLEVAALLRGGGGIGRHAPPLPRQGGGAGMTKHWRADPGRAVPWATLPLDR